MAYLLFRQAWLAEFPGNAWGLELEQDRWGGMLEEKIYIICWTERRWRLCMRSATDLGLDGGLNLEKEGDMMIHI